MLILCFRFTIHFLGLVFYDAFFVLWFYDLSFVIFVYIGNARICVGNHVGPSSEFPERASEIALEIEVEFTPNLEFQTPTNQAVLLFQFGSVFEFKFN